jgi:hypothetical protein
MNREAAVALQVIYIQFRERRGQWPTFAYFERWMYRYRKEDAVRVISRIPTEFLKPLTFRNGRPAGPWGEADPYSSRCGALHGK